MEKESNMCDYTQVEYRCRHLRFVVRAWCEFLMLSPSNSLVSASVINIILFTGIKYRTSHIRCLPNVVAIEYKLVDKCGQSLNRFVGIYIPTDRV